MLAFFLTLLLALPALAGPVPPPPGQPEPGHESVFFVPVKVQGTNLCLDDYVAGAYGDPVEAAPCRGDWGNFVWKPLEDGFYHLTFVGYSCVGYDPQKFSKKDGSPLIFTDCSSPKYHNKWIWKGDKLCTDERGVYCIGYGAKQEDDRVALRVSRKGIPLTSVVIGTKA